MSNELHKLPLGVGLLAHVDAGKTTLSEALLYESGAKRTLGRVDHGDTCLDTHSLEREKGITIFSKQAVLETKNRQITLVDTPGHVDFSAETERTLPILDCAVLIISGTDGIQAHTVTLWKLLQQYQVPTFLFINKMDLPGADRDALLRQLQQRLSPGCIDFGADREEIDEQAALCDEALLETYLETGCVTDGNLRGLIAGRKIFPCCFGAALRQQGVADLLQILDQFAPEYGQNSDFGARVYKISRDPQGSRLTWLKVTGGKLRVRQRQPLHHGKQCRSLYGVPFHKFHPGRGVVKQIPHHDGGTFGTACRRPLFHHTGFQPQADAFGVGSFRQQIDFGHRGNGRQGFTAEAQRADGRQILFGAELTGGMAQEGRLHILRCDAAAVVCDPQIGHAAVLDLHRHLCGTGIHGIFHQFLGSGSRTLHHFTGGNQIRHMAVKL